MTRKTIYVMLAALLCAASCKIDDAEYRKVSEFGLATSEYQVEYTAGSLDVDLISNEAFSYSFSEEDLDWAKVTVRAKEGGQASDATLHIEYTTNSRYPRMATLVLKSADREMNLVIKQKGFLTPTLKFTDISKAVSCYAATNNSPLSTNLSPDDVTSDIEYENEEDPEWISDLTIANGFLLFKTDPNTDMEALRRATIKLTFTDGWNNSTTTSLLVTQANGKNELGLPVPFSSIKDMVGTVNRDVYIEGIIVSEKGNANNGENERLTATSIDYTGCSRTAYIEASDGSLGYRILTSTVNDNVFERYSKVRLLLRDAVVKKEMNPERYTITKVTSAMILSSEAGSASSVPVKEKYINELTDNDVYTWVTLKDCEFGVKKGPLTPINDGYCKEWIAYPVYRISKYPLVVLDNNGGSIYTYTNTSCTYRRDGTMLPYGSGNFSGIIVHESFDQYEWTGDPGESSIGKYQIRHLERSDFAFEESVSSAKNGFVCEYQYFKTSEGRIVPTDGDNGYMIHTNPSSTGASAEAEADFSYLGPCGQDYIKIRNGNGVILPNGSMLCKSNKTNWPSYPSTSDGNRGKGQVDASDKSAWKKVGGWWDTTTDKPGAWLLNFSTEGISANYLTLVLSIGNWTLGGPRYMDVSWSLTGNNEVEEDWTKIEEFTVTDNAQWPNTMFWQLPGTHKQLSVSLPTSLLGKKSVWLRFRPSRNVSGTATGYADGTISASARLTMNYLAIRYNK